MWPYFVPGLKFPSKGSVFQTSAGAAAAIGAAAAATGAAAAAPDMISWSDSLFSLVIASRFSRPVDQSVGGLELLLRSVLGIKIKMKSEQFEVNFKFPFEQKLLSIWFPLKF